MDNMMPMGGQGGASTASEQIMQPGTMEQDPMQQQQVEPQGYDDSDPMADLVDYALSEANLAKKFRNKTDKDGNNVLEKMGSELYDAIKADDVSRQPWLDANTEWLKMALLIREPKTWPWPKAANVKYPLIATAAMQFSARAYPALVPSDGNIVKAKVSAVDKQGELEKKAIRVSKHMSYQVQCEIPNWEENMDKLLMAMAVSGICFKKTYHDSLDDVHRSEIVYPENLIINYHAKTLESAYRKTEIQTYFQNEVEEKVRNDEHFLDVDLGEASMEPSDTPKTPMAVELNAPRRDKATPHTFWSCHTYWDLDGDGYEEPYIITLHAKSHQVVRIVARWDSDGVQKTEKNKIIKIKPIEYFTAYPFIPNPDGSIYACGFGMLLNPLNEAANTIINQLLDAGTLNNMSAGFVGKNLRIKNGQIQIQPGEWKFVNATGEDLAKSFYPIPTKEPSAVLFQLLNMLISSGNQLASIAEIFVGKMPGQNTPATTTQETIQQGMAVFTAIYKRVYRSLHLEFKKIFRLNRICPGTLKEETMIAGEPIQVSDYSGTEHLIVPGADPSGDSATVKMMKLQQVAQMFMPLGTINPMVLTQRGLEGLEIPNAQELIAQPQPQEDPKAKQMEMQMQMDQQKMQMEQAAQQQEMQMKERLAQLEIMVKQMEIKFKEQELAMELQGQQKKMELDQVQAVTEMHHDQERAHLDQQVAATKAQSDIATNEAMNKQAVQHSEQSHQQKMKQAKETQAAKPKESKGAK